MANTTGCQAEPEAEHMEYLYGCRTLSLLSLLLLLSYRPKNASSACCCDRL